MNGVWIRVLPGPVHLSLKTGPLCPMFYTKLEEPCSLSKVPDGLCSCFLMSSRSKKNEPTYVCRSETKSSHLHRMTNEVSSSVPHFLQVQLLLSPIIYKCLLTVLCPVSRPVTTLACVLPRSQVRARVQFPRLSTYLLHCDQIFA